MIKKILKKILLGQKSDPKTYVKYLRSIGCHIGNDVIIYKPRHVTIDTTRPFLINIGDHARITKGVTILTHDYGWSVVKGTTGEIIGSSGKVKIGNNVFVGMNTTILKGVSIGDNCIIGANSLIAKDIPPNSVAAGNPVKVICTLEEYRKKRIAKQEQEATELVLEYYKTYKKWPAKKVLREFIWLFEDRGSDVDRDSVFTEIGKLGGNYEQTKSTFYKSQGKYHNFDDFINYCKQISGEAHDK